MLYSEVESLSLNKETVKPSIIFAGYETVMLYSG